jgi:hypothetical protein
MNKFKLILNNQTIFALVFLHAWAIIFSYQRINVRYTIQYYMQNQVTKIILIRLTP